MESVRGRSEQVESPSGLLGAGLRRGIAKAGTLRWSHRQYVLSEWAWWSAWGCPLCHVESGTTCSDEKRAAQEYAAAGIRINALVAGGFVPATRRVLHTQLASLEIEACPFVNLPEKSAGRWGRA